MATFLQTAEGTSAIAANLTQAAQSGNYEQVISQVVTFCVEAGKSVLLALVIFMAGRFLIKLINRLVAQMMVRKQIDPTIQSFLRSFVHILLTILLLITVISTLGINTTSFAALLASAGVAVGMALSGNLQNLAGGIILLLFKPYRVGDYIEAAGVGGTVREIQIFHTVLVTGDNKVIFVPNGSMSNSAVTNFSANSTRRVDFVFGINYGADISQAREAILAVAKKDSRIKSDPAPFIVLGNLSESSVDLTVRVWTDSSNYWDVLFGMNEAVYAEFGRRGIDFPYPHITIDKA